MQTINTISALVILAILFYILNILKVTNDYEERRLQTTNTSYVECNTKEEPIEIKSIYDCPALPAD